MNKSIFAAVLLVSSTVAVPRPAGAQLNPTQQGAGEPQDRVPVYRMTVVARTTPAVNYRHRGGATKVDFRGTALLPESRGEAKVESKQGYIEIEVEFDELEPATKFGPEYLTYVMWAITPEGRATNLGEGPLNGSESKLNVTTELQAFGLVVTAEPYFAVSQPSDVVVMENVVRSDTRGKIEQVDARYELLKRGTYLMNADPDSLTVRKLDRDTPLELYEARNAVQLSQFAGADEYARESFEKASRLLQQAEDYQARNAGRKSVTMAAREAAQTAEDARLIALERQEEEHLARARQASADREREANARAQVESDRRREAEADRYAAERARTEAERDALRAERDRAEAEAARQAAERSAADAEQRARAEADLAAARIARERDEMEAARVAADRARSEAELAAHRLAQEKAAAEAARAASMAEADRARLAAQQAEQEKAALRARLQQQLNLVLETRESARGLIVNMSDVLFDTDRYTLRPGARERLAKIAGILLAHPGLRLEVEGHTDSVGADEYNQTLSERRASSVRDYLVQQGIAGGAIAARGLGESQPVVTNDSAAGRQQNRRVEVIVSGEAIGTR